MIKYTQTLITAFTLVSMITHAIAAGPQIAGAVATRNITLTADVHEINPSFTKSGEHIIYQEFIGDLNDPKPWDYKLTLSDRFGFGATTLFSNYVVDFSLSDDDDSILVLTHKPVFGIIDEFDFHHQLTDWLLWKVNAQTGGKEVIEYAHNRPLVQAYEFMRHDYSFEFSSNRLLSASPGGINRILVQYDDELQTQVRFYIRGDDNDTSCFLQTEAYKTYIHVNWLPPVLWHSENSFLTLTFTGDADPRFPQSKGTFSIVLFDVAKKHVSTLYTHREIRPFPRFSLSRDGAVLYFQKIRYDRTSELWRLGLLTGKVEKLYTTKGQLGSVSSSSDGTSLLFSESIDGVFDIIRLDLDIPVLEKLAVN